MESAGIPRNRARRPGRFPAYWIGASSTGAFSWVARRGPCPTACEANRSPGPGPPRPAWFTLRPEATRHSLVTVPDGRSGRFEDDPNQRSEAVDGRIGRACDARFQASIFGARSVPCALGCAPWISVCGGRICEPETLLSCRSRPANAGAARKSPSGVMQGRPAGKGQTTVLPRPQWLLPLLLPAVPRGKKRQDRRIRQSRARGRTRYGIAARAAPIAHRRLNCTPQIQSHRATKTTDVNFASRLTSAADSRFAA